MGFFSWKTQDTQKSIANVHSGYPTFIVCMHDNKQNVWTEVAYDGYGVFGGKDYYELLAEMNGLKTREEGVDLAFSKKPYLSPNLTEAIDWEWINEIPVSCKHQGFFYDDDMQEGAYYPEQADSDEDWEDWEDVDIVDDDDPAFDHLRDEERNFIDQEREKERGED